MMQRASVHRSNVRGDLVDDGFSGNVHGMLGLSDLRMGDVSEIALTLSLPNRPENAREVNYFCDMFGFDRMNFLR